MLKLLNTLLEKKGEDTKDGIYPMTKDDITKKRAEVLRTLGYKQLPQRDASRSHIAAATKDFALF